MSPAKQLGESDLPPEDLAFYGLVWAGNTLGQRVGRELMRHHGLPLSWFEVLLWLSYQDAPVSVSDLGSCTMLSRSQVSRVVDALHERGLIERGRSQNDARSAELALTAKGRTAFGEADATRRAALDGAFTGTLDEDDLASLVKIWGKLKDA
ncbi:MULTISPECIES: MarR family winged helix-turn-helix transcriptional regulator [Thermomonosporaceae]|uniref:MarR family winged helix-turn-helix transcriptional regulator n=1 Tax=Thermomonosporaceae TaxID=2012 RepID=UPI00255A97F9|nr:MULTISPECIES: MarR family winged helix-turn-helix transcriptional regulator [Thermomonosporaceae]MDL4777792.1 MarR family winged helix-turn-helix transcriptional regulator [Actinomadura xylanilytica]